MILAKDARKLAEEFDKSLPERLQKQLEEELNKLSEKIKELSMVGWRAIGVDYLSPEAEEVLLEHGYRIKHKGEHASISWDN